MTRTKRVQNSAPNTDLFGHYVVHSALAVLYFVSPLLAWTFDFHPLRQSAHGWFMFLGAGILATMAYGPPYSATHAPNQSSLMRRLRAYRIFSPIWAVVSVLGLVALWVLAFHESYDGSVFLQ